MLLSALRRLLGGRPPEPATPADTPPAQPAAVYNPGIFNVSNIEQAKNLILTSEGGSTTPVRWEAETAYLASAIGQALSLDENTVLLDYGCGIGRVAQVLIGRYRCPVVGLDISQSMRDMAVDYVKDQRFSVVAPEEFAHKIEAGTRVDCAMALWVLQHSPHARGDIALIKAGLKNGGLLYILNNENAAIPTNNGWLNDGFKIRPELERVFTLVRYERLPLDATNKLISENAFIGIFRNDKS